MARGSTIEDECISYKKSLDFTMVLRDLKKDVSCPVKIGRNLEGGEGVPLGE
jgi:hypothetical protein